MTPPVTNPQRVPVWQSTALVHYPLIEHVHVAPDGAQVLYTIDTAHVTDNASEFRAQVYRVATAEPAASQPLTHGLGAASPKWSPDGTHIAFLRRLPDSTFTGLWIMPAAGGEPWPLLPAHSDHVEHESILQFEWRPDGRAIAYTSVPTDAERKRRKQQRDDVHHWQVDFDFAHLYILELDAKETGDAAALGHSVTRRRLTHGRVHVESFTWHPAGTALAYIAQDTPFIESWTGSRLMRVEIPATKSTPAQEPVQIAPIGVWKTTLAYSPDGIWIACQQGIPDNHWPYAGRMYLFAGDACAEPPRALADVSDAQPGLIGWTPDSRHVLVLNDKGLGTEVLALPVDGGAAQTLVAADEPCKVAHLDGPAHAPCLALVRQNHHTINGVDIVKLDLDRLEPDQSPRRIATPHASDFPQGKLPQVHELQWTTSDGLTIDGILYLPHDYAMPQESDAKSTRLPLLLHIHGGPMGIFQRTYAATPYYYTPAALCEQGIAVLRCNPRGSSGYGKDFRFANMQDWGGGDYRDLLQGVDQVIDMGIADPDRLGVCGWSYGGFMTSWIITQTHRFVAASIGAPLTNAMSFPATADIPSFVPDFYGGEAWEVFDFYKERSPIFHAHKVRTPAILQHGEADLRVPLEQGLQYYYVLARNNVPVDLYIYPRQGHAILEPRLLTDAIKRNLDWFAARLGVLSEYK